MKSLEALRNRLEGLFSGLAESIPRTGKLSPRPLGQRAEHKARGWVWELDPDGVYTWCSPEVKSILGFEPEEVLGTPMGEVSFTTDSFKPVQALLSTHEHINNMRVVAINKSGDQIDLILNALLRKDDKGEPLGYRGACQVLGVEEVHPERLFVSLPQTPEEIGVASVPPLTPTWGPILGYIDDGHEVIPTDRLMSFSQDKLESDPDRMVVPIQFQNSVLGVLEFESSEGDDPWSAEDRTLAEGIAQDFALALEDTRSHRLTQQALEEMREADRLKTQFLANMSHELRTPLNSIIGFSRVILKGIDGPINENQKEDLTAIYNAGQHLLGLISDILDLSQIEAGRMELSFTEVDMAEIIRGVMSTAVGLVTEKPIELSVDLPEDLPEIKADKIRVRQILLNLISNAAKFTEEGQIGVTASVEQHGTTRELVVAVFDTGAGIDPKDQTKIFEPFSQVDASPTRKTGGTGLGLSICRHLVELHGGHIWVESMPGKGSTFAFTLPFEPAYSQHPGAEPLILGVNPSTGVLNRYQRFLETLGYRFHSLTQPGQTIEVAHSINPQVILLDALAVDDNGWELLSELRQDPITKAIPIFLGHLSDDQAKGVTLGSIDQWIKPVDLDGLCDKLMYVAELDGKPPDILIVDDVTKDAEEMMASLQSQGCSEVRIAATSNQALHRIRERQPDLIILNLLLKNGEGAAALDAIRGNELSASISTILLSSSDLSEEEVTLLDQLSESLLENSLISEADYLSKIARMIGTITSSPSSTRSVE